MITANADKGCRLYILNKKCMGGSAFIFFSCRIRISAERAFQVEKAAMRTVEYQKRIREKDRKGESIWRRERVIQLGRIFYGSSTAGRNAVQGSGYAGRLLYCK